MDVCRTLGSNKVFTVPGSSFEIKVKNLITCEGRIRVLHFFPPSCRLKLSKDIGGKKHLNSLR
mgnify:CR=1 FL=1